MLDEKVSAVVPTTWKAQSSPKGVYEPADGDEMFSPAAEFRIAWLCGDGCKPVDDWGPVLEEKLFKAARGWTWKVDREEKSATQRFLTAHAPNGTVEITRVLFKNGEPRALYCQARLMAHGGSVLAHDPVVDRLVGAFEEACLAHEVAVRAGRAPAPTPPGCGRHPACPRCGTGPPPPRGSRGR